jgi:hypothetical protein
VASEPSECAEKQAMSYRTVTWGWRHNRAIENDNDNYRASVSLDGPHMHCTPPAPPARIACRECRPSAFACRHPYPCRAPRSQGRLIGSDGDIRLENGTDSPPPPCLSPRPRSIHLLRSVPRMNSAPSLSSIWMLHLFYLDVAKVDLVLHMLQLL